MSRQDRIRNRCKLSFPIDAPNNGLGQDMIVLSYPVFLSCAPNDPIKTKIKITTIVECNDSFFSFPKERNNSS